MTSKAVVTGHSRGLGLAVAEALLGRGIPVLGLSRSPAAGLAGRFPGLLAEVAVDLGDPDGLAAWAGGADLGRFLEGVSQALLVNNAGLVTPIAALGRQGAAAISRAVAVNVAGPLVLADAFVSATGRVADRRILHVSSGAGRKPYAGWSVYCATKAALDMHAQAAMLDGVPGLRVSSVAPGVIDTDMQATIRGSKADDFPTLGRFHALKAEGGLSTPAEAAGKLVSFLLRDGFGGNPVADVRDPA